MGIAALFLAVVAFPVYKVQFVDRVASSDERLLWVVLYVGVELVICAMCLLSLRAERRPLSDIGLVPRVSRMWWAVLVGAVVVAGILITLRHFEVFTIAAQPGQEYGALSVETTAARLGVVAMCVVAVPVEEIIWRGFATSRMIALGVPTGVAVAVPSIAFGYFHGGTVDTIVISVAVSIAVIVLSIVYLRSRSLAWPMLLHFAWNIVLVSVTPA